MFPSLPVLRTGSNLSFFAFAILAVQIVALAATIDFASQRRLAAERFGDLALEAIDAWELLIDTQKPQPLPRQLRAVNEFFNTRARWSTDEAIYQQADYWATPLELLARQAADCEDYAIAKYLSLLALGVSPQSLRLIYVRATLASGATQAHMVLAWYPTPEGEPLILDNLNPRVLPAGQRTDLSPVFSFSATELWIGARSQVSSFAPRDRMSRWRDLLDRAAAEGFKPEW